MPRKSAAAQALHTILKKRAAYRDDPDTLDFLDRETGVPGGGRFMQQRLNQMAQRGGYPMGAANFRPGRESIGFADDGFNSDAEAFGESLDGHQINNVLGVGQPPVPMRNVDVNWPREGQGPGLRRALGDSMRSPLMAPQADADAESLLHLLRDRRLERDPYGD